MSQEEWRNPALYAKNLEQEREKQPIRPVVSVSTEGPSDEYRPGYKDGQNLSPAITPFQRCSEGDLYKKSDPDPEQDHHEPLMGLAMFLAVVPEGAKLSVPGLIILSFLAILYFLFRYDSRKRMKSSKSIDRKPSKSIDRNLQRKNDMQKQQDEEIGFEAGGVPTPSLGLSMYDALPDKNKK